MGFHGSGMATQSVVSVRYSASNFADSAHTYVPLFQNRCRSLARLATLLARMVPHSENDREV